MQAINRGGCRRAKLTINECRSYLGHCHRRLRRSYDAVSQAMAREDQYRPNEPDYSLFTPAPGFWQPDAHGPEVGKGQNNLQMEQSQLCAAMISVRLRLVSNFNCSCSPRGDEGRHNFLKYYRPLYTVEHLVFNYCDDPGNPMSGLFITGVTRQGGYHYSWVWRESYRHAYLAMEGD
jgi:hypothetical protein